MQHLLTTEEPDPEPNQRNDIDDDRIPFSNLNTDYSPSYTHKMLRPGFSSFDHDMEDHVDANRRQYYGRTPSPLRQHAGIGSDSCTYIHALQQADHPCLRAFLMAYRFDVFQLVLNIDVMPKKKIEMKLGRTMSEEKHNEQGKPTH